MLYVYCAEFKLGELHTFTPVQGALRVDEATRHGAACVCGEGLVIAGEPPVAQSYQSDDPPPVKRARAPARRKLPPPDAKPSEEVEHG